MNVCDNLGDHLVGNVYIKVRREGRERSQWGGTDYRIKRRRNFSIGIGTLSSTLVYPIVPKFRVHCRTAFSHIHHHQHLLTPPSPPHTHHLLPLPLLLVPF